MQTRTTTLDLWTYPEVSWSTLDLSGYDVEALDGSIGDVDDDTAVGSGHLVVSTGPLIFGRKVMLPAGVISSIDLCVRTPDKGCIIRASSGILCRPRVRVRRGACPPLPAPRSS